MRNFFNFLFSIPAIALALDLWINASRLILQYTRQDGSSKTTALSEKIPVGIEDIQFIQVFGNCAMALIITLSVFAFIRFAYKVTNQDTDQVGGFTIVGLLVILAYTLPGTWTAIRALIHFSSSGTFMLSWTNPWHTLIALLLPCTACLCCYKVIKFICLKYQGRQQSNNGYSYSSLDNRK